MSAQLAQQQSQMLSSLLSVDPLNTPDFIAKYQGGMRARASFSSKNDEMGSPERGWLAYRAHAGALAVRVLQAAYPGVARWLGEAVFAHLARSLWRAHPPRSGDLAQWGGALGEHIARSDNWHELLIDFPALQDVARVEWALHRSAAQPDEQADSASWALLASHDPARLRLQLSCATERVSSGHRLVSTLLGVGLQPTEPAADTQAADVLIWRQGYQACWCAVSAGDAALTSSLLQGLSLASALEQTMDVHADVDFQGWLLRAARTGLLIAVHPM